MAFTTAGGCTLFHETIGSGTPVVLIPGMTADHAIYWWQRDMLGSRHACVLLDNRGTGRSTLGELPAGGYTLELLASDIAAVLDTLDIERAHIYGGSMGGTIAQTFALLYPKRVRSLMLHSSWCRTDPLLASVLDTHLELFAALGMEYWGRMMNPYIWSNCTLEGRMELLEEFAEVMTRESLPISKEVYALQVGACKRLDLCGRLGAISCPTLVTVGADDLFIPPRHSYAIHRGIRRSRYVEIDGAGHGLSIEKHAELNQLCLDFMGFADAAG